MKDHLKSDDKNFNISLMSGLFVAVVITAFEILESILKVTSNPPYAEFIIKIIMFIFLILWLLKQHAHWRKKQRKR